MMVEHFHPEIVDRITYKEVCDIHKEFLEKRKENERWKIGYPNWLLQHNKIDRGLYLFPSKFIEEVVDITERSVTIIETHEKEYQQLKTKFKLT